MKITPVKLGFPLTMSDPHRGDGLHVSDIYNDLYQDLEPARYRKDGTPPDLKMALGLAWEQYLEKALVANGVLCARPGEQISSDKIKYSPDLLIVNGQDKIGEIKLTWLSAKVGPTHKKFSKYLCQGMIYGYWAEIPRVRYYILHIVGEWNFRTPDGCDPIMNIWDVEFTARELKENYQTLMNHAAGKKMINQLVTKRGHK